MRPAALKSGYLSTRVGRRTLLQFLGAAMLPVLVVAILGATFVRRTLESESINRVQRTAQSVSLVLLGGLTAVTREFAGRVETRAASADVDPLSPDELSHVREGAVLLHARPARNVRDAAVDQWRRTPAGRIERETIRPALLWESIEELVGSQHADFCVFVVGTWQRVHCSPLVTDADAASLRADATGAGGREGARVSRDQYVAHRDIFLRFQFGSPEWRVMSAEPRATVLAAAADFTKTLGILLAIALVTAFGLGHRQIRRSTVPLESLRDATRRVMKGDLQTPLSIGSGDEYEELGTAFNTMTRALDRQLGLLRDMDAVDEAALRERRVDAIVETSLDHFGGVRDCLYLSVATFNEHDPAVVAVWSKVEHAAPSRARQALDAADRLLLLANPRHVVLESVPLSFAATRPSGGAATSRLVLPLMHEAELLGAITLDVAQDSADVMEDLSGARRLADRIALGLANVLFLDRLDALSSDTLKAFARAIDANSAWTAGHSERVTQLAIALGRELRLSDAELATLKRGGLMHDIGKIGVPPAVLDKQGALTGEEFAMMKRHPEIGEQILAPLHAFRDALPIVRSHHERVDGSGYPDGLAGEAIPWLARILAVADVYDALASDRPYRAGLSQRAVVTIIERDAGTHFDPRVVDALLSIERDGWLGEAAGRLHTDGDQGALVGYLRVEVAA